MIYKNKTKARSFTAVPSPNAPVYEVYSNGDTIVAKYDPFSYQLIFNLRGNPTYRMDLLKVLPEEDRKLLGLSKEEISDLVILCSELPSIRNGESLNVIKQANAEVKGGVNNIDGGHSDLKKKKKSATKTIPSDSNTSYTEPQTLSWFDNDNNWHHFYIFFTYMVDGLSWEVKVPCGDINLIENYNKRKAKARELRRKISARLKRGWHPYNQKSGRNQ